MRRSRRTSFLLDANVLIDFSHAGFEILRVLADGVGRLHVPLPVLREEVDPSGEEDWPALGVTVVEPDLSIAAAAATRRPGLSFHDHLCLLLARAQGWTCVTNDGRLRRECQAEGIPVCWGLELVTLAVEAGGLLV